MNKIVLPPSDDESDSDNDNGISFISGQCLKALDQLQAEDRKKARSVQEKHKIDDQSEIKPKVKKVEVVETIEDIVDEPASECEDDDEPVMILECKKTLPNPSSNFEIENLVDDELFEEEVANRPIKIKIKRLFTVEFFSILPNQPISAILDEVSERFNISVPNIILYLNDNIVDTRSTPTTLKVTPSDFFEILARFNNSESTVKTSTNSNANDPNFITLHLRDNTKKRLTIRINRFKLIQDLAEFYAKEKNVDIKKIKLEFDSDHMSFDKKISSYDMEDDDQIDINIIQ